MNILKYTRLFILKKVQFLLIIFIIFIYSCKGERQETDDSYSYILIDSLSNRNIIEDNIDKCRFIKLETTDDCLIAAILKMEFDDEKIFIKDSNDKLFVFDNEGMYLQTIGKIGPGPDELLNMFDFYLDKKENTVNILDIYKSEIFKYSYSGELLEKVKLDRDLLRNTSKVALLDDNHLLMLQDNDHSSLFNYLVFDTKKNDRKEYLPYMAVGNMSLSFGKPTFAQAGKSTYMCAFLSDTIYKYDSKTTAVIPHWIFRNGLKPATKEDFDGNDYELGLEAISTAKNKNLSTGVIELYSTEKYLHFTFNMDGKAYRVFFDMDSGLGSYYEMVPTDTYTSFNNLIATTDKAFVCAIPVEEALSENREISSDMTQILKNSQEDDNPILVFYSFN